jgi:hypothetical protein
VSSFFAVKFFGEAFITLLVITDPPGVVPPFIGQPAGCPAPSGTGWPGRRRSWRWE